MKKRSSVELVIKTKLEKDEIKQISSESTDYKICSVSFTSIKLKLENDGPTFSSVLNPASISTLATRNNRRQKMVQIPKYDLK